MVNRLCRLLLLAFPQSARARVGESLVQTLVVDSRTATGRLSVHRFVVNAANVVRMGLAERMRPHAHRPRVERETGARWALGADLRHVRRSLSHRRGVVVAVFATLALGLGLNTAIFSVVNSVLLTGLPYREPSRLAFMWTKLEWIGVPRAWVAGPHIDRLAREATTIDRILPLRTGQVQLQGGVAPEQVYAGLTTAPLFDVLDVAPALGRAFVTEDEPRAAAILTHGLWMRRYGGDPAIVGQTIDVDGDATEVIGVLPAEFRFQVHASLGDPRSIDIWLPTRWPLATMSDSAFSFAALVRVRGHATLAQAQAELDTIGARLDRERYKSRGFGWQLVGVQDDLVRKARPVLLLIGAGAGLVLLVGCANIAGLMLVRTADRRREFAIRTALGASRLAVMRLVVLECLAISVGAAAGIALAWAATRALVAIETLPIPRLAEIAVDWRVLVFAFVTALATGLIFGVVPAWRASREGTAASLQDAGRGASARAGRLRASLVAAEMALAVLLVASSVLLARSYSAARGVDPGFARAGVLTGSVTLTRQRYPAEPQAIDFFRRLMDRLAGADGVVAVGGTSSPPLAADTDQSGVRPEGWAPPPGQAAILSDLIRVTPGAFDALGMTVVAGRDLGWQDGPAVAQVAVVDQSFVRAAWPNVDPIGRRLTLDNGPPVTVVGVVRHARQYTIETDDRPQVYRPYAQDVTSTLTVAIRTTRDPEAVVDPLRQAVREIDRLQPISAVSTLEAAVDRALATRRLQLETVGAFALAALLLCAIGVYGLVSSFVADRTREIAIRLALGANRAAVRHLVIGRVVRLITIGVVTGIAVTVGLTRTLERFLFGVPPHDPASLLLTAAVLLITTAAAVAWPIRRALSIAPARALVD